ncbi:glycoside hydrolase domain-containing protein [Bacteroides sp.]|uniref:DUF4091 domain-containing protein n=1 Tax=Bacteroides sp. TaxID=29523 RepID=UPI001B5074A4|nr:glycoside hydrolase domain-containing protein [Bacteroides sp.]MBP6065344.1 DUF4091 domain-containing protein [Bacteroides sp.]MBP6067574.1 DUF4091 domain-containing protein [Bacteroides sp.]MBP6936497.1 DUF4091 domain-containing protein [Bacteroides sp.]MBP8622895.1 DUF4091 domain-containing protein [Bacteroides sp.]MBP9586387.1 DUF4091 domain-containing protein [Bacteroides sp.]
MKRTKTLLLLFAALPLTLLAQQGVTQCGTPTLQPPFPIGSYNELPNPQQPDPARWAKVKETQAAWGTTNRRYSQTAVPEGNTNTSKLTAWRGEKVQAQAVVYTPGGIDRLTYTLSEFTNSAGETLPATAFEAGFVRYVMTDELNKDGKGGCGYRPDHSIYDSTLVADPIDHTTLELAVKPMNTQAIWVSCTVPQSTVKGKYKGQLLVKADGKTLRTLPLEIEVLNRVLPAPAEWSYHLDLWQNPFAVARYYQVPLWSEAHFNAMRPTMKRLADAGQKIITASIMHKPWGGQTHDYFETMVTWMKKSDGTWAFDYTIFDQWVTFMMGVGIDQQINCYSMIPWKLSFKYFDQATNSMKTIDTAPGKPEYNEMWRAMLASFSTHLRQKGWFDKTVIAMDERPMKAMQEVIALIREVDPEYKVALAGNYHAEIEKELYDYSIAWGQTYPEEVLKRRQAAGQRSTYYTCCTEVWPNMFTFSQPAESTYISLFIAKDKVDGYLRWAFNSWPLEPLLDSRFSAWAGGDTYIVYPGNRTSIRFEKLIEGIQAYEKVRLLQAEFEAKGDTRAAKKLQEVLAPFKGPFAPVNVTTERVERALKQLNAW